MKKVKLAIDFGSANMKMIGKIDGQEKKKIIRSVATTDGIQEYRTVTYDDKKIYFGIGDPLVLPDKTRRDYIIESIFLATHEIYGELKENQFEIQLAIGLPISQYKSSKCKEYEMELQEKCLNEKLQAVVDGKNYTIKITFLKIYAEGFSGFIVLADEFPKDKPMILIDMGYKTTEVLGIKKDINSGKLIIDSYKSIDKGMLEVFNVIHRQFLDDTGMMNYNVSTIENAIIANGTLTVIKNGVTQEVEARQWLKNGASVLKSVFNIIETEIISDMQTRKIYLIGGGVEFIYKLLKLISHEDKYRQLDVQVSTNIDQSMFANVIGYMQQLERDAFKIIESEDIFISDDKLERSKKTVAVTKE